MPITLTVPEGALDSAAQQEAFAGLTQALLKSAGLNGNVFMEPNTVGTLNILPRNHVFSAGKPVAGAFIELKLPAAALATLEAKYAFIDAATTVVERASKGQIRREHIWTNIIYAADGAWGIGGQGFTNADLGSAIQRAASGA